MKEHIMLSKTKLNKLLLAEVIIKFEQLSTQLDTDKQKPHTKLKKSEV